MSEYERREGMIVEDLNSRNETWTIEFRGEKVHFSRWIDDKPNEMYRPLSLSEGAIAAAAIFQGFQPPHRLRHLDKTVRRTEFEEKADDSISETKKRKDIRSFNDVLMSRDNRNGWKLEELLRKVREELAVKNERMKESLAGDLADEVMLNNLRISQLLIKAQLIQFSTMESFKKKLGPDRGPSKPRI